MMDSTFMLDDSELDTICEQYKFNSVEKAAENVGKRIMGYKLGSEYASGGAGCISTVEDYMKFLEGLRTYKLLKKETVTMITAGVVQPAHILRLMRKKCFRVFWVPFTFFACK